MIIKKKKKPKFLRPNYKRSSRKRIKDNWRRQRGIDNKKRIKKKYMGKSPSIGYSQDKRIRGFHPSGTKEVLVTNIKELENAPKDALIRISSKIGKKLKTKMLEIANKLNLKIVNAPKGQKTIKEEKQNG